MISTPAGFAVAVLITLATAAAAGESAHALLHEDNGVRWVAPVRDPGVWANPWPTAWEGDWRKRMSDEIIRFKGKARTKTDGESEKWSYPDCFGAYWAGDLQPAIAGLTATDDEATRDHAWTGGFDFYWCFNLKGQAVKWFLFRNDFPESYRAAYAAAAKTWTASDPRPTLEYVLLLDAADAEVRAFALAELKKMWRDAAALKAMADAAEQESAKPGQENKRQFVAYIRANAERIGAAAPGDDPAAWRTWWATISAGDWMVFEEYERRVNPNPHPKYGVGTGPVGGVWNPEVRGTRADARNTDNLRAMREVAVYLFAEDSGNELIRKVYKEKLRRTALGFWSVGNGEWDSEGYLAHAMSPYHSLYAFAKDDEVRGFAKATLDFLTTSAAVKYWRGCWGGPSKRDYGNVWPWSASAHMSWLFFGDAPMQPAEGERETTFAFHSGYRPPAAVVALARKRFVKPMAVWAAHPSYSNWLPGAGEAPESRETMGWGETWQMGSLARGGGDDVSGCKILVWNDEHGCDYVVPGMGASKTITNLSTGADNLGQHRNLLLWLSSAQGGSAPMQIVLPLTASVEMVGGIAFIQCQKTWLAALPVNGHWTDANGQAGGGKAGKGAKGKLLIGAGTGGAVAGFALEIGDQASHGDFVAFKAAIQAKAKVAIESDGAVSFTGASGAQVKMRHSATDLPKLWLDGVAHDWSQHTSLWRPAAGGVAPVNLGWKERVLTVEAGGHRFSGTLSATGAYTFSQQLAAE